MNFKDNVHLRVYLQKRKKQNKSFGFINNNMNNFFKLKGKKNYFVSAF